MGVGKTILNAFGLLLKEDHSNVRGVAFSLMGMAGGIVQIIGVVSAKPLSQRFGKRAVFATSLVATAVVTAWLMWIPADDVGQLFLQSVAWGIAYGPSIPLLWSMIADAPTSRMEVPSPRHGIPSRRCLRPQGGLGVGGFLGPRSGDLGL
jgi:predicted MFS family arabinose efflux permease